MGRDSGGPAPGETLGREREGREAAGGAGLPGTSPRLGVQAGAGEQPPRGPWSSTCGSRAGEQTAPRAGARGAPLVKRACVAAEGPRSPARAGRWGNITSAPSRRRERSGGCGPGQVPRPRCRSSRPRSLHNHTPPPCAPRRARPLGERPGRGAAGSARSAAPHTASEATEGGGGGRGPGRAGGGKRRPAAGEGERQTPRREARAAGGGSERRPGGGCWKPGRPGGIPRAP